MAEATLTDVRNTLLGLNEEQGRTTEVVSSLVDRFQDMLDFQKRTKLDDAEADRENKNKIRSESNRTDSGGINSSTSFGIGDKLLAGAVLSLAALSTFLDQEIEKIIQDIRDAFLKFFIDVGKIAIAIDNFLVKPINARLITLVDDFRAGPFSKAINTFFDTFRQTFKFISGALSRAVTLVSGGLTALLPSFDFLKGIARVFSKLFLPLTIFITAWDTVKGFLEGFEEEGIVGGIKGAVTGFFNSLIFAPLDLLKQASAFVLNKLGFENAANFLNSFSFQDLFTNIVESVFGIVGQVGDFINELLIERIPSLASDLYRSIENSFENLTEQLRINFEVALLKVVTLIQNIPDRLVQFLSDNLRISIPKIAIPIPRFLGGGELVIAEPSEIGVPGGETARARIAERNARLDARLLELSRQNLADVGGVGGVGTNIVVDNSTVAPSQTSVVNQLQTPIPLSESTERVTLSD